MRFHYAESMTDSSFMLPLAKAAEANGYSGYMIPDSLFYPRDTDSKYFYNEDGNREFLEDKEFIESFVLAAAMAGATTRLEFTTFVVKLPVRPPIYSAKLAASVAVISNNRFNFGIGLSVWPEDFKYMGVDFAKRGKRFDECIDIVVGLCKGGYFEYHGEFYDFPPLKICPTPSKPLPIMAGGHADVAIKRAAERCDGWLHAGGKAGDNLDEMLKKLAHYRKEAGTDKKPYRIFVIDFQAFTLDGVKALQDKGVTDVVVGFRDPYKKGPDPQSLQEKIDLMKGFADTVVAKAG